ncbi:MAG: SDR family NAD(P)-dependent oxidoreductase [Parvibaculales bacterium]
MSATDISTSSDLPNNLDGHIALVTGASSGLGAHFARVLASAGARVIIAARRMDRLQLLATQLNDALDSDEPQIICHALDVNALDKIPEFFAHLAQAEIMPDILINNAGMNIAKSALDMQPEDVNMIMSTNMIAPFFMATEFARHHIAAKQSARIINIASVGATHVLPSLTPYCMSKAGIMMMTRGLAREWARFDINVNAICPGYIETEINDFWWKSEGGQKQIARFPRRRLGEMSDLDGVLLLLAGGQGKGINGSSFTVDDGQYI